MSQTFLAILISTTVAFGNLSTSAWSATDTSNMVQAQRVQTADAPNNSSPLPPGAAAGIKEAQGVAGGPYWLDAAVVIGTVIIIWILMDQDDTATTTTGT